MTFTIDASEFEAAADALEAHGFDRMAGRTVQSSLRKMANVVRKNVRKEARPHRRTGKLASKVRVRYDSGGMDFTATIRSEGRVAHLIAGGVRPHDIAPGKVMPIHGAGKAQPIVGYATAVHNRGFRADPYFARGVRHSARDIQEEIKRAAAKMVADLALRMSRRR